MSEISAEIVKDSISHIGVRLTTFALVYPRFILAEVNTHRVFSRNSASSRAIPVKKMIEQVKNDPAIPIYWGSNKPGMQAGEELTGEAKEQAIKEWLLARDSAVAHAEKLLELGLHKQISNRILEPWMWAHTIITATDWGNFYNLRCDPDAQPEMKQLAEKMLEAHNNSIPQSCSINKWHIPYVSDDECMVMGLDNALKCSAARCARVSYKNHDGTDPDVAKDLELYERLIKGPHVSPMEHQATPDAYGRPNKNFKGWIQFRTYVPNENQPNYEGLKNTWECQ